MNDEIVLDTGPATRLVVREHDNSEGHRVVTLVPERWDGQEWAPTHAGLILEADPAWIPGPLFAAGAAAVELLTGGLATLPPAKFQC